MGINLLNLQPNIPKANIEDYVFTVYGRPKSGKTSLFARMVEKFYGNIQAGLLLAFEKGYQAMKVVAQDINCWEDFLNVLDQLEKYKAQLSYKTIAIDTADIMYKYAADYVCRQERRKTGKNIQDIADIAYGKGYSMVSNEMQSAVERIIKAGYGLWILTHDKDKKFESRDGISYDKTTCSLPATARDIVLNIADFIIFIDIAKEKQGEKLVDKRYIYFRAEGADLEAGSRFETVPNRIDYDVDLFIETFEKAVQDALGEGVDIKKIKQEQAKEKEKEVKVYLEEVKDREPSLDQLIRQIIDTAKEKVKENKKTKEEISEIFKQEIGTVNPNKIEDIEVAKALLEKVQTL